MFIKYSHFNTMICSIITGLMASISGVNAQDSVFTEPEKLSDSVNSMAEESFPVLTDSGKAMYYVRTFYEGNTGGKKSGNEMWYTHKNDTGAWQKAHNNFPTLNNKGSNAVVGISDDGNRLYLLNNYGDTAESNAGLSFVKKANGAWGEPENFEISGLAPQNKIYGLYFNNRFDIAIVSMVKNEEDSTEDLYYTTKTGPNKWSDLKSLGPDINSDGFEMSPFLGPDGKTMYFSSDREGGHGNADVYKSKRKRKGWQNWTEPVNLGDSINSEKFDAYFTMTHDSTIYLASNRDGGFSDLYKAGYYEPPEEDTVAADTTMATDKNKKKKKIATPKIHFGFDKYNLKTTAKETLDKVVDSLKVLEGYRLRLGGHADSIGTYDYNLGLSRNRSESVKNFLTDHGIDPTRIKIKAYSHTQPIADNSTDEGRGKNRRVEIHYIAREPL